MISRFIWNGQKPKLCTSILVLNKSQGGRNLVNLALRGKALKVEWVNRMYGAGDGVMNLLAQYHVGAQIKNELWECNINQNDVKMFNIQNRFSLV